jgi:hypothetical protein
MDAQFWDWFSDREDLRDSAGRSLTLAAQISAARPGLRETPSSRSSPTESSCYLDRKADGGVKRKGTFG